MTNKICAVATTLIALLTPACSNHDAGLVLPTTPVATTTTTSASASVAPTTIAPTTTPATGSVSPETTTTLAPATSLTVTVATEPPATTTTIAVEDQVKADFLAGRAENERCNREPATCDVTVYAVPGSPYEIELQALFDEWAAQNIHAVEGHGGAQYRIEDVTVNDDTALLTVCGYDTTVIYAFGDPATSADDSVFNGEKVSRRVRWQIRHTGGRWLIVDAIESDVLNGGDLCGF